MRGGRQWAVRGAIAAVLVAGLVWAAAPGISKSTGLEAADVTNGAAVGCTCHSPTQNGRAIIAMEYSGPDGLPLKSFYYTANQVVTVRITFDDPDVPMNANATANKGGFYMHTTAGKFKLNANSTVGGLAYVQLKDSDATVTHTGDGDKNANRSFTFDWVAPGTNTTDAAFVILVNAVNGDGINDPADHWSQSAAVFPGDPKAGGGGPVDISKLGVPLRAYWLGVIGILSTIFLLVLSFYVIRSGSKFYEFGLPRGQVKSVKIRTVPAPKTRGSYAVMTGLIVILIIIVVVFFSIKDESLTAMQATGFLMAVAFVMALAAGYYIRAFLPLVDVLEEETIEPLT